jgi:uncharacterized alpha-E superfamily protein
MLLSRVADNLYWAARYLERAEDTARLVRSYTEMLIDLPTAAMSSWQPLLAVAGNAVDFDRLNAEQPDPVGEMAIVRFMIADHANPSSIVGSVSSARENLRTTREVLPREAWQTMNDLFLFVRANAPGAVDRRGRARFLGRIIADCQQLDGVMTTVMNRDDAYEFWRLGQSIERADMTTRVVGVRAAALMSAGADVHDGPDVHDDVQWMGLLRSVSALQMYQRVRRGPIDATSAVRFLLLDPAFPRSVASCAKRIREALTRLPRSQHSLPSVDALDGLLVTLQTHADDGAGLDAAMEAVQQALVDVNDSVNDAFVRSAL